jgi:hypothetical protein
VRLAHTQVEYREEGRASISCVVKLNTDSVVFGFKYAAVVLMNRCRRHNAVSLFFNQRNEHDNT